MTKKKNSEKTIFKLKNEHIYYKTFQSSTNTFTTKHFKVLRSNVFDEPIELNLGVAVGAAPFKSGLLFWDHVTLQKYYHLCEKAPFLPNILN